MIVITVSLQEFEGQESGRKIALKPPKELANRRERELFIKWKYMSYWHCEWVNEMVLDVHFTQVEIFYAFFSIAPCIN